jgi:hypothetical protein
VSNLLTSDLAPVLAALLVGLLIIIPMLISAFIPHDDFALSFDEEENPMPYKVVPASVYFTDQQGDLVFVRTVSIKSVVLEDDRVNVHGRREDDCSIVQVGNDQRYIVPRAVGLYLVQLLFPEAYADYEDTRPLPEGFEPPTDEEDTAPATLKAVQS